jgi:hypothetical protein
LEELLRQEIDWPALLADADDHGLFPLLYWHLNACAAEVVPAAWLDFLRELFRQNAQRNLLLTSELLRVLEELERAGVVAVPYKGPVLAVNAYGHLGLRHFVDLDLLVRHRDILRAQEVFNSLGYNTVTGATPTPAGAAPRIPGQYAFSRQAERILLEVHTERTLRYFPAAPDFELLWQRLEMVELGGKSIRTLAGPDLFSFLCVHGTKHLWGRLSWICDIAELARVQREADWPLVRERARAYGAERMVLLGLALVKEVLEAPLPAEIEGWLRGDRGAMTLARQLRARLVSDARRHPGALGRFLFRVRMLPRLWEGLRYALHLATTPTEEDWGELARPGPFTPTRIAFLRLLRLLKKYGFGLGRAPAAASISGFEPTSPEIAEKMLEFAGVEASDVLYDLGCGDGRIVIQAARRYGIRAVGVDVDPQRIEEARDNARKEVLEHLVSFRLQDARAVDLREATVVTLYLPWAANLRLRETLRRKLRSGARVVSRDSSMGDWLPEKTAVVQDSAGAPSKLLFWRI